MEDGHDVLIVYDDLTQHARAYRELSLLLRRPPGREAYPGDIFYLHARLLERATQLAGGGSLTALPVIETQAQDLSAYIPTNLISITDGQLYLAPGLAARGILPAVDVGRSVSRVGGKAQSAGYRAVAGDLRLTYAQFEELEGFSRFGTELDAETQRVITRGRRVRVALTQGPYVTIPVGEQLAALWAASSGALRRGAGGAGARPRGGGCARRAARRWGPAGAARRRRGARRRGSRAADRTGARGRGIGR
jgi:F-type H+/Na+-transporting ATPase subunit alpha